MTKPAPLAMSAQEARDLVASQAKEIQRLCNLVRAAGITCEECGGVATFADRDDWCFCSVECMGVMEARHSEEPKV